VNRLSVFAFVVALLGSLVAGVSSADPVAKEQVRHLSSFRAPGLEGRPIEITSEEDFARHFGKEALKKVKGEVDFSTEKVVYVGWRGSSSTRLGFTVTSCRGQTKVSLQLATPFQALTDDRLHGGLVVMPKEATWTFAGGDVADDPTISR
jgi:hypothetical protein